MKMTANEIRRDFLLIQISIMDKNSFKMNYFKRIIDILDKIDDKQLESEYEKDGMVSIEDIIMLKLEKRSSKIDTSEGSIINDIVKMVLYELKN